MPRIASLFLVLSVGCAATTNRAIDSEQYDKRMQGTDSEIYEVEPATYPKYRTKAAFKPPRWTSRGVKSAYDMVEILPTDVWNVTHKVGDLYLINSNSYDERQCKFIASFNPGSRGIRALSDACSGVYLYHIYVTPAGHVSGGWQLIKNPALVLLKWDRKTFFDSDPKKNNGWGEQPLFVQVK